MDHDITVRVRAVGTALPGTQVSNSMLAQKFGMPKAWEQWIESFVDTTYRHFAFDLQTGELLQSMADLGTEAGAKAIKAAGLTPDEIDLVVMGTASPDLLMPATVNVIADRLGVNDVPSYQLQSGCSGALQALDVARQMLATGRHRNALVIGAETLGKHYDAELDLQSVDPAYGVNVVLFGDGAGAAVLTTDDVPDAPVIQDVRVRMVGLDRAPGQVVKWYGMGDIRRGDETLPVQEDYKAIEERVPAMAQEIFDEVVAELEWDEIDYLLPPQLSGRMTDRITAHLGRPDLTSISCVRETGNIGNATPFFQLERLLPRLAEGDRAVCISIESSKWIKAGFGLEKV